MPHEIPLITMLVAGLGLAFVLGALAHRVRVSPIVGYLLAGVLIGPATPGYVADPKLAAELAEIGVILLMFGVGLHFSLKDLLSVRNIAIPGAVGQIALATGMGLGLGLAMGWGIAAGLVFGLALSVASTVVLLRALQERRLVETTRGRIAVGWLVVEDLAMVLALVLLPAIAGASAGHGGEAAGGDLWLALAITLGKVAAFVALMLLVGRRVVPWLLHVIAHSGSRELFRLAVLSIALGFAYGAAELFGVSFALGAFFAGMILSESALSQRAAEEALPLRDAFGVLFFVSVGMLFDPRIIVEQPLPVLATVAIIVIGKSVVAFGIVRAFRHSKHTAYTISASLAQIGEFSFILASLGIAYGLLPSEGQDLILAGAIISILANPVCFALLDRIAPATPANPPQPAPGEAAAGEAAPAPAAEDEPAFVSQLSGHTVLVGFGRVGSLVGAGLVERGLPHVVVEERGDAVPAAAGREIVAGNGAAEGLLPAAGIERARLLFVAIPEAFEAGQIVGRARAAKADLTIIARAHSDAEVDHLRAHGADVVIMGEREIARGMLEQVAAPAAPPSAPPPASPGEGPGEPPATPPQTSA